MAQKIQMLELTDFSGGLNTRQDPRVIAINESPLMSNIDITSEGAIITRTGYEKVCDLAGKVLGLFKFKTSTFNRLLIWCDNGHLYYITNLSNSVIDAGSYTGGTLTATAKFDAIQLGDLVVFGNGTGLPMKYDGTTISAITTYAVAAKSKFFEVWGWTGTTTGAYGFSSGSSVAPSYVYGSKVGNINDWDTGGALFLPVYPGSGDDVTGLKVLEDNFFIFKRDNTYIGKVYADTEANFTGVKLSPNILSGGCVANGSLQTMFNDVIRLADPQTYGVCSLGLQQSYFSSNQRMSSLSWKIQPSIRKINSDTVEGAASAYFNDKYFLSVPTLGNTFNDTTFVYSLTVDGRGFWTTYSNLYPSFYSVFIDSTNKKQLFFGSDLENALFKFNSSYVDNGQGYDRIFRTKTLDMGARVNNKNFIKFWIRGAMPITTSLKCRIVVDGVSEEYTILNKPDTDGSLGIMGDNILGNELFGGPELEEFTRFMYRDDFTLAINNGREIYFEFYSTEPGQAWKIDYIGVTYTISDLEENYPMNLTS